LLLPGFQFRIRQGAVCIQYSSFSESSNPERQTVELETISIRILEIELYLQFAVQRCLAGRLNPLPTMQQNGFAKMVLREPFMVI
jgi:hypothetical protein